MWSAEPVIRPARRRQWAGIQSPLYNPRLGRGVAQLVAHLLGVQGVEVRILSPRPLLPERMARILPERNVQQYVRKRRLRPVAGRTVPAPGRQRHRLRHLPPHTTDRRVWNQGALRLKGYRAEGDHRAPLLRVLPKASLDKGWRSTSWRPPSGSGRFEDEGWRVRKDGTRFWASSSSRRCATIRSACWALQGDARPHRAPRERGSPALERGSASARWWRACRTTRCSGGHRWPREQLEQRAQSASRLRAPRDHRQAHFHFLSRRGGRRGWPQHELEVAARLGASRTRGGGSDKDGGRFWANVVITPLRGVDGQLRGFSKITATSRSPRARAALRQSEERFRLLLEGIEDYADLHADDEGRVTSWNRSAGAITGYTLKRSSAVVRALLHRRGCCRRAPAEELRRAVLHRRTDRAWERAQGRHAFWADVIVTSLHDPDGRLSASRK